MKSLLLSLPALLLAASTAKAGLILSEIDLVGNKVEIINTGTTTENLTGYWFCNLWQGSPVYIDISAAMIVLAQSTTTTLSMPPGSLLTLQVTAAFITDMKGELGLYTAFDFGNPNAMVDYVCWGGDSNFRDDVAAAKGIWGAATFVPVTVADLTAAKTIQLKQSEDGNTYTDYELAASTIGTDQVTPPPPPPIPEVVISEIDLIGNKIEIINTGTETENLTGCWFNNLWTGTEVSVAIEASMIVSAESTTSTLSLPPGGILTLQSTATFITDNQGELGLYISNDFANPDTMVDYVSWGGDSTGRDDVAATKGIWGAGTFVPVTPADLAAAKTIQLKLGQDGNDNTDYELAASTIGINQLIPPVVPPSEVRITGLSFNAGGDFVITFTPVGETTYILTSSNNLVAEFEEETHAVFTAPGTFTVPAAFLNPGRDYFRIVEVIEAP